MAKRVLFLNGPSQDVCDRFFGWPTSLLYAISPTVQAIRRGSLDLDYVPQIFDPIWYLAGQNDREVKKEFGSQVLGADIICASATYDALYPALQLLAEAKRLKPEVITILGGPHFDEVHNIARFNDVRLNPQVVDFGIAGDGEFALYALLQAIERDGVADLRTGDIGGRASIYTPTSIYQTSGKPLPLDELPFMPIELADWKRHRNDFDIFTDSEGISPTVQMIAKRGCGYRCDFCSERSDLAYPNARPIENILEEVYLRKKQGFRTIFFDDSTFGLYPRLGELLAALADTGMSFGSLNRFDQLTNPRLLQAYRDAGFIYFYCAIEQFNDEALSLMNKDQDTRRIHRSVSLLSEFGFMVGVSLLYGLPYENERSLRETLDFTGEWVDRGTIRLVSESVLSYHPGTPAGKYVKSSFNRPPPNQGFPFNRFEEGQWYHPEHVTAQYLERILRLSEDRFGSAMVRNRHSWYTKHGYAFLPVEPVLAKNQSEFASVHYGDTRYFMAIEASDLPVAYQTGLGLTKRL